MRSRSLCFSAGNTFCRFPPKGMETDPAKLQVVLEWLKSTYGNTPAPSFEVNPGTVAVLYDLAIKNQKANAEAEVEIELLRKVATEAALQSTCNL